MQKKILVLCDPVRSKLEFNLDIPVDCCYAYCSKSFLIKIIRRNKFLIQYVLSSKLKRNHYYTHIIVFDTMYKPGMIRAIRKNNQYAKILFYFRNTIRSLELVHWKISYEEMKQNNVEIWSYSKKDCEKYGFKYNAQFIDSHLLEKCKNNNHKYDLVFIGDEKHRSHTLKTIYEECEKEELKSFFSVRNGGKVNYNQNLNNVYLPYDFYIKEYASQSKALLDVVTDENYGLTLRPLEALFLNKKLITNYKDIIHEEFYDAANIFVFDNKLEGFSEFLNTPRKDIPEDIKEYYTCESWIKRFL